MEAQVGTNTVIINVAIQVLNIAIFFFLFKFFLSDKIGKGLEEREALIKKLKEADVEYQKTLNQAKQDADNILYKAKKHAEEIVLEGESLAKKNSDIIKREGEQKAKSIMSQAEKEAKKLESSLINNWTKSLKETSKLLVKKIIGNNQNLQEEYIDTLVNDLKK